MKKLFVLTLLTVGMMGATASFAQDMQGKKADKKEVKAGQKEAKGKMNNTDKQDAKMEKKESKAK